MPGVRQPRGWRQDQDCEEVGAAHPSDMNTTSTSRFGSLAAYLRRFFTSWVAADPDPQYSGLDRADGLGRRSAA